MMAFAKSLRRGNEQDVAYQLSSQKWAPNFSRSGPRSVPIGEEPSGIGRGRSPVSVEVSVSDDRSTREERYAPGAVIPLGDDRSLQPQKGDSMNAKQDEMFVAGRAGAVEGRPSKASTARWLSNPFGPRPTLRADAKGQLSLEFVKVVRNDLSDADLELVPSRVAPPMSNPSKASSEALENLEPEPSRWSRFTARIFGPKAVT